MNEGPRLVRRPPTRPLVWLGEPKERDVAAALGQRFPAYPAKEKDLVFDVRGAPQRDRDVEDGSREGAKRPVV